MQEQVKLSSVMEIKNCHNCRVEYPIDSMTVDMIKSEIVQEFQGQFDLSIHAASKQKNSAVSRVDHPVNISFEVKSRSSKVITVSILDLLSVKTIYFLLQI